jgi:hypothetical protein
MNPSDFEPQKLPPTRAPYTPPQLEDNGVWIGVVGITLPINSLEWLDAEGE